MSSSAPVKLKSNRRWLAPCIIVAIPLALILLEYLWERFEISPAHFMKVGMAKSFSVMLAPVALLVWLLFFSGFSKRTKSLAVLGVLALVSFAFAVIRKVEFNGQMRPIVYYRWDQLPQDALPALQVASEFHPHDILQHPADSPYFRGMNQDGTTPQAPENAAWVSKSLEKVWQHPLGGGHAGISVIGKTAYTIEQRDNDECIVAYDINSGSSRWSYRYPRHSRIQNRWVATAHAQLL